MNSNKTKIDALKMVIEGFSVLLDIEQKAQSNPAIPDKVVDMETERAEKVVDEVATPADKLENINLEEYLESLKSLNYAQLKKEAVKLGVEARGTKAQILNSISAYLTKDSDDDDEQEDVAEEDTTDSESVDDEQEDSSDDEQVEDTEEAESSTLDTVLAMIEENGLSDDDLRDILADVDISTKGDHEALVDKIVSAIDDGILQFDDDEEDSDGEDSDDEKDSDDSVEEESEDEESEDDSPSVRDSAIEKMVSEIHEQWDNGDLDEESIVEFLEQFGDVKIPKKAKPEALLKLYIDNVILLIDDEGNTVEEGAYFINDEPYCCGRKLEIDDNGEATCSVCGESYEFEDEE